MGFPGRVCGDTHSKDYKGILVQWRLWGPLFMGNTMPYSCGKQKGSLGPKRGCIETQGLNFVLS